MPTSILLIVGVTQTADWYADDLKKSRVLSAAEANVETVTFDYGANAREVARALDSGLYKAAIVSDLSAEQSKFTLLLGTTLKRFVSDRGGRLAFPTTEGLLLQPVLASLFNVPWTASAYGRCQWEVLPSRATAVDELFPLRRFLPTAEPASRLSFYSKSCSFRDVPLADRCFGEMPQPEDDYFDDHEEEGIGDDNAAAPVNDSTEVEIEESDVNVCVRRFGTGLLAFFGDVNCQEPTADLVAAFCLA